MEKWPKDIKQSQEMIDELKKRSKKFPNKPYKLKEDWADGSDTKNNFVHYYNPKKIAIDKKKKKKLNLIKKIKEAWANGTTENSSKRYWSDEEDDSDEFEKLSRNTYYNLNAQNYLKRKKDKKRKKKLIMNADDRKILQSKKTAVQNEDTKINYQSRALSMLYKGETKGYSSKLFSSFIYNAYYAGWGSKIVKQTEKWKNFNYEDAELQIRNKIHGKFRFTGNQFFREMLEYLTKGIEGTLNQINKIRKNSVKFPSIPYKLKEDIHKHINWLGYSEEADGLENSYLRGDISFISFFNKIKKFKQGAYGMYAVAQAVIEEPDTFKDFDFKKVYEYLEVNSIKNEYSKIALKKFENDEEIMAEVFPIKIALENINKMKTKAQKFHSTPLKLESSLTELNGLLNEELALHKARTIYKEIKILLKPVVEKIELVGSASRLHEVVNDLDIVAIPKKDVKKYLESKGIEASFGAEKAVNFIYKNIPVNIWLVPKESFGAAVLHFSSGKAIIQIKRLAIQKGLKLNRYGLFKGNTKIAGKNYDEILKILGTETKFSKIKILEKVIENSKDPQRFIKEGQFPRETENYYRFRQEDPDKFNSSTYKLLKSKSGNARLVAKLKTGKWETQSLLISKDNLNKKDIDQYLDLILQGKE